MEVHDGSWITLSSSYGRLTMPGDGGASAQWILGHALYSPSSLSTDALGQCTSRYQVSVRASVEIRRIGIIPFLLVMCSHSGFQHSKASKDMCLIAVMCFAKDD